MLYCHEPMHAQQAGECAEGLWGRYAPENPLLHHCCYHPWHLSTCLTLNPSHPGLQVTMLPAKRLHVQVLHSQMFSWTPLGYLEKPVLNSVPRMCFFALS